MFWLLSAIVIVTLLNGLVPALCYPKDIPFFIASTLYPQGDDNGLQLDFRYDESLASPLSHNMPEQPGSPKVEVSTGHKDNMSLSAPSVNSQQTIMSPTSPATEDLNSKIAAVKNFWIDDPLPPAFESKWVCMKKT